MALRRELKSLLAALLSGALAFSWPAAAFASETLEFAASQDFLGGLPGSSLGSALNFSVPEMPAPAAIETGSAEVSLGSGLKVFFVNVFQGDAEYIELPNGKTVLIDAGPAPAPDSQYTTPIVSNFLTRHGVKKIDYMVLTHPHADHYGGMKWVFDTLQVDHFYDTGIDNSAAAEDEAVRKKAKDEPGCAVSYPAEGDSLDWGSGVKAQVLHSCPNSGKSSDYGPEAGSFVNDCSIVIKLTYQGSSILFTGDVGSQVEADLAQSYGDDLSSDILKVGHHGSATSSSAEFLNAVKPKRAYIEVGRNSFGHPTQAALDRLQAAGAAIYRTDKNGTQEIALGNKPAVEPSTGTLQTSLLFKY